MKKNERRKWCKWRTVKELKEKKKKRIIVVNQNISSNDITFVCQPVKYGAYLSFLTSL